MGDPRTSRKKYETPTHPWQGPRISDEAEIVQKFGLKNKREVWKAETFLRDLREQARNLQAMEGRGNPQAEKETDQLIARLHRLGVLAEDAGLADVLALSVEAILTRRLQTQVYLKGLASTPEQARQLITHGHVAVDGASVSVPSYKVERDEEATISYAPNSPYRDPDHPDRPRVDLATTGEATEVDVEEPEEEVPDEEVPDAEEDIQETEEPDEPEVDEEVEEPDEPEAEEAEEAGDEPDEPKAEAEEQPEADDEPEEEGD